MKDRPLIAKPEGEFRWRANGTYDSHIMKGLNKIRFVDGEGGMTCQFLGRKRGVPFDIELSQILQAEVNGNFTFIWEDIFAIILAGHGKPEYLSHIAAAGVTLASNKEEWPLFNFNTQLVGQFRKHLPKAAQRPFLFYCKKEWTQRFPGASRKKDQDFKAWCDAEIAFVNAS